MKFALPMLILSTVACHSVKDEQPRNFADPAVSEALAEPMMSDVQLQAAASADASESSGQPSTMKIPKGVIVDTRGAIPLKQVAAAHVREPGFSGVVPLSLIRRNGVSGSPHGSSFPMARESPKPQAATPPTAR